MVGTSPVSFTKTTLSYPIVAASFDPYRNYLVVGGGGGAGAHGVGNKITVLDVSSRSELDTVAEIELARDEDSVTSLANLASADGVIALAGLNSSEAQRKAGKNEHFRSFLVEYPKEKKAKGSEKSPQGTISLVNKTQLFSTPEKEQAKIDVYQRVIRLSRPKKSTTGNRRIGAVATSSAGIDSEVVIFDATSTAPRGSEVIQRIKTHKGLDANDIDILEGDDGEFRVAYCTDQEVFLSEVKYDFAKKKTEGVTERQRTLYTLASPDALEVSKTRGKIRSLRWLSPTNILLLVNLPNRSGVELRILRLYGTHTLGSIVSRRKLASHVKAAVDLDICELDSDASTGAHQIVVAVGGADVSISIFTIEYKGTEQDSVSSLRPFTVVKEVHPFQITKLAFQPFFSPWAAAAADRAKQKPPPPQYIRLASTSFGNTVVVDTFSVNPLNPDKSGSRYVLSTRSSEMLHTGATVLVVGLMALVTLIMFQSYLDMRAEDSQISLIPQSVRSVLGQLRAPGDPANRKHRSPAQVLEDDFLRVTHSLRDLLPHRRKPGAYPGIEDKTIVVRGGSEDDPHALLTEVHADPEAVLKEHAQAKRWEELTQHEQERWKERLVKSGQWARGEGVTVLKGIFFSEYAGFVGQVVADAIRG